VFCWKMNQLMMLFALLLIVLGVVVDCSVKSTLDPVGPGIWNARASFDVLEVIDIGTHMTVVQLQNGKFLVIDTVQLQPLLKNPT